MISDDDFENFTPQTELPGLEVWLNKQDTPYLEGMRSEARTAIIDVATFPSIKSDLPAILILSADLQSALDAARKEGEERGFSAANIPGKYGGRYGCNPYGRKFKTIEDWRNSEDYNK